MILKVQHTNLTQHTKGVEPVFHDEVVEDLSDVTRELIEQRQKENHNLSQHRTKWWHFYAEVAKDKNSDIKSIPKYTKLTSSQMWTKPHNKVWQTVRLGTEGRFLNWEFQMNID